LIFSRRRRNRQARDEEPRQASREDEPRQEPERAERPTRGPYDISEAPSGVQRLDLGSLHIPPVPGVELRVQADPTGRIQQVVLIHGQSALQLGVFAAPRSEGIWDEVRAEIRSSLQAEGAPVEEIPGEYGVELRTQVRTETGEKTDLRFVGIDRPRWMVRAVFQGPAARDPANAGPLAEVLSGLVVDRGRHAMPVREPLPLRLPREFTQRAGQGAPPAPTPGAGAPGPWMPPR
jgi:hypothetical protein